MRHILILTAAIFLCALSSFARNPENIDNEEKKFIVDSLSILIEKEYVFPEIGDQIAIHLREKLESSLYDEITDYKQFSEQITNDLRAINGDKHLALIYAPDVIKVIREDEKMDTNNLEEEFLGVRKRRNFGFFNIEIMDGNIGYLRLDNFYDTKQAGETAVAAMQFLANTYAIILDLRYNGGGNGNMVKFLSTYFLGTDPEHLNTFYSRKDDKYYQSWTIPYLPGKDLSDKELFILTSNHTFSAAEEFCYNLKNLKRAIIVGEPTGGGAHPVTRVILNDNFGAQLAIGRAINPVTESNWEGIGVLPDIEVTSQDAKEAAYMAALKKLVKNEYPKNFHERLEYLIDKNESKE